MKLIAMTAAVLLGSGAFAQSWPQKPVRFIVPFPPGGATDISARLLGEKLTQIWGQQVVIENRGGAGGGVGAAEAARAAPDGYTLFFPSGSVVTANQHIYSKLNYDPEKDFVAVTNVVSGPQVVAVPAASPYKTVKDLIDALRANPGKLTFGHAGIGSQTHLAAENFLNSAKVDAVAVPYKGEGPALAALVAGDITFAVSNLAANLPFFFQAEDGIRDVAVTGVQTCALPISYSTGTQVAPDVSLHDWFINRWQNMLQGKVYEPLVSFSLSGQANGKKPYWDWDYKDIEIGRASCRERVAQPLSAGGSKIGKVNR